jgi:uncharacterized LabA/DUF88 family protein
MATHRTFVYIDGFNLYYGKIKGTPYRWLDLDKFCQSLFPSENIQSIKYFTALVSGRPDDPDKRIRQQVYLRALGTLPKVQVYLGHFLTNKCWLPLADCNPIHFVHVRKTSEKGSDVNLATYLLHDGFKGLYDHAIIISNDSDLREPVRVVRDVLGLRVGIANPHERHSKELQEYATYVRRVRPRHLAASLLPASLNDAKGDFCKPATW